VKADAFPPVQKIETMRHAIAVADEIVAALHRQGR
jgi:hypothetical protein